MIVTLCYLFVLLWDVPVIKENFAHAATWEFGVELFFLFWFLPLIIAECKSK